MSDNDQRRLQDRLSIRLSWKGWLSVGITAAMLSVIVPRAYWRWEAFPTAAGYRIPHRQSNDYWLFRRHSGQARANDRIVFLGDSVVWGEYVLPDESWSQALNEQTESQRTRTGRAISFRSFANGGVNGMHPLAMSGLVASHGKALRNTRVLLHCNLLWLSSPERDLRVDDEVSFNHPELIPQFGMSIPSYRAVAGDRLRNVIRHNSLFFTWVDHLRAAHFDGQDYHHWSLDHPYENPLARIELVFPPPLKKRRHRAVPWHQRNIRPTELNWATDDVAASLQWRGSLRVLRKLRDRENRVFVVVGPLNVHMLKPTSRRRLGDLRRQIAWALEEWGVPFALMQPLQSDQYADASHPLAHGYRELARRLLRKEHFVRWMERE